MFRLLILISVLFTIVGAGAYALERSKETEVAEVKVVEEEVIGTSHEGRDITAYTYGNGPKQLVLIGGIHGGYEWNTVLLAYELMDYFDTEWTSIPTTTQITIIPVANPDGLYAVMATTSVFKASEVPSSSELLATGRFTASGVDLNRNFDCKWQPKSMWGTQQVSAGTEAFSEPEAKAIRDFIQTNSPDGVLFFHSKANAVYASECHEGVLTETKELLTTYAEASGYEPVLQFDAYPITGDAEGWLASIGIPALTVELETREGTDFEKNLRGVKAVFEMMHTKLD